MAYVDDRKHWEKVLQQQYICGQFRLPVIHRLCATNDATISKLYMRGIPRKFQAEKGLVFLDKKGFHPIAIAINRKRLTRQSLGGAFVFVPTTERDELLLSIFTLTKDKLKIVITFEQARDKRKEAEKEKSRTHSYAQ